MATSTSTCLEDDSPGDDYATCKLCLKHEAKYTCPRCNIRYCSTECYKGSAHMQCSETFYRDCFMEGLKQTGTTPEEKKKMMAILQKVHNDNQEDDDFDEDDEGCDLAERLEGVSLDGNTDKIWALLTKKEKAEFETMLSDGRLGQMVELWVPWWTEQDKPVMEISAGNEDTIKNHRPEIMRNVPDIKTILKHSEPAVTIQYDVLNVLYGYAYVARLNNGDHMDSPDQCADDILSLCASLTNKSFKNVKDAIHTVLGLLQPGVSSLYVSQEYNIGVLEELVKVLHGPSKVASITFIMCALSDVYRLFKLAKKGVDRQIKKPASDGSELEGLKEQKKRLYCAQKKVEFYLSWTHKYGLCLGGVVSEIEQEFCELSSEIKSELECRDQLEKVWGGKTPSREQREKCLVEDVTDSADR